MSAIELRTISHQCCIARLNTSPRPHPSSLSLPHCSWPPATPTLQRLVGESVHTLLTDNLSSLTTSFGLALLTAVKRTNVVAPRHLGSRCAVVACDGACQLQCLRLLCQTPDNQVKWQAVTARCSDVYLAEDNMRKHQARVSGPVAQCWHA
jgi:hypothetical protein